MAKTRWLDDRQQHLCRLGADIGWDRSRLSHHLARMQQRGMVAREDARRTAED